MVADAPKSAFGGKADFAGLRPEVR